MSDLKEFLESDGRSNQTVSDVVQQLITTEKNLSSKTEFSITQVVAFTKALAWADRYRSTYGKNVIKFYMENLISLNRKGRIELVEALGKAMIHEVEMNRPKIQL